MIIRWKHTISFIVMALYAVLAVHDHNLYPHLGLWHSLILSLLRFFLLLFPVVIGNIIARSRVRISGKVLLGIIWVIFVPYTIYSITEIRHVAELCRLLETQYYTEVCLATFWKTIPIFLYAFSGAMLFVCSLSQVAAYAFTNSWRKRMFIVVMCMYAGFASTIGLYGRLNVWDIFTNTNEFAKLFSTTLHQQGFAMNVAVLSICSIVITFSVNRFVRRGEQLLYGNKLN